MPQKSYHIGFVSTRLAGTDGVSLETVKWVQVLESLGLECFFFAGESDLPEERCYLVPEAHFTHPEVQQINADLFDDYVRSPETTRSVERLKHHLKSHLYAYVRQFDIAMLIVENAMAIPMNVPLGLALTEFIAETEMPTVGHHHDFFWERRRYAVSSADDYLRAAFPSNQHSITHVAINTYAQRELALRTGASSFIVPNVMDFANPPPKPDGYVDDLRERMGISSGQIFMLQPTRIVPRKRIERAILLAKRLGSDMPATVVISHASGDEGSTYAEFLNEYIELLEVDVRFAAGIFAEERGLDRLGQKVYSLSDAYHTADVVTYPSTVEGFGNAFLEAIYYCRPIVMSTYEIYRIDIKPKGFKVVEFGDFLTNQTVEQTRELITYPELVEEMVTRNYEIARRHYSYENLEKLLAALVSLCMGD